MEGKIVVLCEHVSGFHGQTGITPPRRAISFRRFTRKTSYIRFTLGNKNTRMCRHVRIVQPDLQRTPRRGEGGGTPPPSPMHGGHGNCGPPGLPPFLFPASAQSACFTHTTHTHNAHPLKGKQRGTYPPPCVFPRCARERGVSHPCSISSRPLFRRTAIEGLDRRVCICPDHRVFTSIVAERSPECRHVGGVPVLDGAPRRGGSARALNPVPGRLHELIVRELRARDK